MISTRIAPFYMKATEENQGSSLYSAKNMSKPINFYCSAPEAHSVLLQGDFTDWNLLPMQRRIDGWWFLEVPLTHGHHQYRFMVDGQPKMDPHAAGVTHDQLNQPLSVIAVS